MPLPELPEKSQLPELPQKQMQPQQMQPQMPQDDMMQLSDATARENPNPLTFLKDVLLGPTMQKMQQIADYSQGVGRGSRQAMVNVPYGIAGKQAPQFLKGLPGEETGLNAMNLAQAIGLGEGGALLKLPNILNALFHGATQAELARSQQIGGGATKEQANKEAAIAGLIPGITHGIPETMLASKDVLTMGARRSPGQVRAIMDVAPEFKPDIFAMVDQPYGKEKMAEWLGNLPFGKQRRVMQSTVKQAEDITNGMVDALAGGIDPSAISGKNIEDVSRTINRNESIKNNNYQALNEKASQAGVKIPERQESANVAKEYLGAHKKALNSKLTSSLSNEADALGDLKNFTSTKAEPADLDTAMNAWSDLKEKQRNYKDAGKKYLSGMYGKLADAWESDISKALEQSGVPELSNDWKAAKKQFKEDVLPFRAKSIKQYTDPESTLAPNKFHDVMLNDRNIEALKKLPKETQYRIAHQKMTSKAPMDENGFKKISPAYLANQYKGLPEAQRNVIFDPTEQNHFNKLNAIKNIISEYKLQLDKPFTGGRVAGSAVGAAVGLGKISPTLLAKLYGVENLGSKYLSSDVLRNMYATGEAPKSLQTLEKIYGRGRGQAIRVPKKRKKD